LRDWFALPIPRLAAGFAAGVLVTLLGARFFAASAADDATVVALLSDHTRALMADSTIEVASSNSHTVKPWLSAKLGYSPDVVDLSQEGYPLIGGRRGYLGSTPVAVMAYAYKEHEIDLYALTAESATRVGARLAGRDGYNVRSWSRGGMRYIAVSDVAGDRLDEFVSRIQAHQDHTSD
jgi:anti-sigma factor RsiW